MAWPTQHHSRLGILVVVIYGVFWSSLCPLDGRLQPCSWGWPRAACPWGRQLCSMCGSSTQPWAGHFCHLVPQVSVCRIGLQLPGTLGEKPVALQIYRKWPASLGLRQNWFISSFAFAARSADILPPWPCCVPRGKAGGSLQGATHRGSLEMRCHTVTAASSFSAIRLLCNSA